MEWEQIMTLIKTVSQSSLTSFTLEDKDWKISMEANRQPNITVQTESAAVAQPRTEVQPAFEEEKEPAGQVVTAPLVGTFYHAPSPEDAPFVQVGDSVKKGQVLGIIEAMKLMNEIESEYDGVVQEILVENEVLVEYGQPLFVIR